MNLRNTALLFGLLLGMLWLFGLMLAYKKGVDEALIVPGLQESTVSIDKIVVQRKEADKKPEELDFTKDTKTWRMQQAPLKYSVLTDSFKVDHIVNQIRDMRRNDEADVRDDPEYYGLTNPQITVTLKGYLGKASEGKSTEETGKKAREWQVFIGKTSPDKTFVYVNTAERRSKVYAVRKSSLDSIFFKDPSAFRPKTLLDVNETTARFVDLKASEGEIELKKNDDGTWRFIKPNYGLADFEGKPPSKLAVVPPKQEGVKGLLTAIGAVRVTADEDFVPLSDAGMDTYGLEEGKEKLKIEVGNPGEKKDEMNKSVLLVGFKVKDRDQYYVRLANDQGVEKIDAKALTPVFEALQKPGQLRSRDVIPLDPLGTDAIDIRHGKNLDRLWKLRGPQGKDWKLYLGKESHKADDKTVQSLIDALRGKGEVQEFFDEPEPKKKDAERGFDQPAAEVVVYKEAIAKEEKKDRTGDKEKKQEEKSADGSPALKKDMKPLATLTFGKTENDLVFVKRTTQDGTESRFAAPKSIMEKVIPPQGAIAFFDTALPSFEIADVNQVELMRKDETFVIQKGEGSRWLLKDRKDYAGKNFADDKNVNAILKTLGHLTVQKWVKRLDPKEDLDRFGLTKPELSATVMLNRLQFTPTSVAGLIGLAANGFTAPQVLASDILMAGNSSSRGETMTFKFGKEASDKEGGGVYSVRTGVDYLFQVAPSALKEMREADLRDRTWLSLLQPVLDTTIVGMLASPTGHGQLLAGMPLVSGQVVHFDAGKAKEMKVTVRTTYELRKFDFAYSAKDKTWQEKSGLREFTLDVEKVKSLVNWLADLHAERFIFLAGGPREEQKLAPNDAILAVDIVLEDSQNIRLTVGASFEGGGYFAMTSTSPEVVFTMPKDRIDPLREGVGYFGKTRVAAR